MEDFHLKEFGEIKISEIMVQDPLSITLDEKISTTEVLMLKKNIGGLPVVNKNHHVIGIITQRDIRLARFAISLDSPYTIVKDLMTPEPHCVKKDDSIRDVLDIIFEKNVERLPVVNKKGELIGLVLLKDILKKLYLLLKESKIISK